MAENTTKNEANNNEKKGRVKKALGTFGRMIKKHKIISLVILATIVIVVLSVSDYYNKKKNATEDPNDPKNGPAAANEFINNTYIDEDGNLKFEKSIRELWNEMKQKGNMLTKYLDSPEQLAKLLSASVATDFPDTRRADVNGETPDDPIDWSKYDLNIDSTDVQGIVKFKRALSSGEKITMTYLSPNEFQKKMNKYNRTGKKEDRDEALKYFTIERTLASSGGTINVGTRAYNDDKLNFSDNIDIYKISGNLYGGKYDAVQGCCFDGKNIICSANLKDSNGNGGSIGGRVFWVNLETKKLGSSVDIDAKGGHMEGIAYDSANKWVLVGITGSKLIRIDNVSKSKSEVKIPNHYSHYAYSVTTQELLGYKNNKVTFMKYDSTKDQYVESERGTITLNNANITHVQGISCDGQVIYVSDSRPNSETSQENYRLWAFDFQGNKVEEHKMGEGYKRGTSECENCFVDKEGTLWIMLPHELVKAVGYKGNPVDWENNISTVSTTTTGDSTSSSSSVASGQDIVNEAEKYVGKLPYVWGGYSLETGADCSGFCWAILHKLGLYSGEHLWTVPFETKGEEVSSLAQAQAGDMIIYGPAKGQSTHMAIYDGNGGLIHEINESMGCQHYGDAATWGDKSKGDKILTIRRFTDSTGTSETSSSTNITKSKYVYKVKVATWEENTEIVTSTDESENKYERNYSMNPITIPYQSIVSQYRMPFNYLWTMLIYSQDKNYTFDLADLVRNSQIEITIHDNENETKITTVEETTKKYTYTGTASKVKFDYTYSLGLRTSWF